jgi:prolyl-tRNA synthetase
MEQITPQGKDFSQWYLDTLKVADVFDYTPVKGAMVIKPYGWKMWELFQKEMNTRMEEMGVENAVFPTLIPESFFKKEAEHVEGFAPELLTVTRVGKKELEEPYVLRPTSETIIYDSYARWIHSYRDLPLKMNQWANIFRWEMKTKPFLRTSEFFWQEGHTVHQTAEEAEAMVLEALDLYTNVFEEVFALKGIRGKKTPNETFAGALYTTTLEVLAKDGKAIQSCTSHNLAQNFSQAFGISFTDQNEEQKTPFITCWGTSTRALGTLFVAHGDDKGLKLPPKIAPIQVVIIPVIMKKEQETEIEESVLALEKELKDAGIRVKVDRRDLRPGNKFAEWDIASDSMMIARRDTSEKFSLERNNCVPAIFDLLEDIHQSLLRSSEEFLQKNTSEVFDFESFCEVLETRGGFIKVSWCGDSDLEKEIQEKTKATIRCIPFEDMERPKGKCFYTGKDAKEIVVFAKSY